MDISSKKVAASVRLGKQRRSHLRVTKTHPAQPQDSEIIKREPSFDGGGLNHASSSKGPGSMKRESTIDSIEKPLFVLADWATRFLPTLYHVLFCSEKPFHEFSKGSTFADTVQDVLDIVHPGNTYIVTTQSKIYTTVRYLSFAQLEFTL
jgi:hypothetical protein